MTADTLIAQLLEREGGYVIDPKAGATKFGITAPSWGAFQRMGREATRAEVKAITRAQATAFYQAQLAASPFQAITYEPLRVALFDFGVNSGTARATRWLQRLLHVVPCDGVLGAQTLRAVNAADATLLTDALAAARGKMISDAVRAGTIPADEELGLLRRALAFVATTAVDEPERAA